MRLMSDKEIKNSIDNVKTSLAVEGLVTNKRAIANGQKYLKGKITSEQAINDITAYILQKRGTN